MSFIFINCTRLSYYTSDMLWKSTTYRHSQTYIMIPFCNSLYNLTFTYVRIQHFTHQAYIYIYTHTHTHTHIFVYLILMDPCIVDYSVEIPTRCSFVIEFIIPKFFKGSACFERHTAHHQELQTVFAASAQNMLSL